MKNSFGLPTPYEVSKIAAALRGKEAIEKPVQAVKEAICLWLAAAYELAKAEQRDFTANVKKYAPATSEGSLQDSIELDRAGAQMEAQFRHFDSPKVRLGTSDDDTEVLTWLENHASDPLDRLKSFAGFKEAWDSMFSENEWFSSDPYHCTENLLKLFVDTRVRRRKEADAKRKHETRAEKKQSRKTVAGQPRKVRRKSPSKDA